MTGLSAYSKTNLASYFNGTTMPAAPAALYVALFNGDPTDAGTGGTEVTTTIRTAGRLAGAFNQAAGTPTTLTSSALIDFGNAVAGATMTHAALFDAQTGGHMIAWNALTGGSQTVSTGTDVSFAIGSIVFSLT